VVEFSGISIGLFLGTGEWENVQGGYFSVIARNLYSKIKRVFEKI
jgi:hypothetical protein